MENQGPDAGILFPLGIRRRCETSSAAASKRHCFVSTKGLVILSKFLVQSKRLISRHFSLQVEEHLNGPAEETPFVLSRVAKTISKPHARFAVLSAYLVLVGAAK